MIWYSTLSVAQSVDSFYWYFDKKIELKKDSSHIITIAKDIESLNLIKNSLKSIGVNTFIETPYNAIIINLNEIRKEERVALSQSLLSDSKSFSNFCYESNSEIIYPLNQVIVKPKGDIIK